MSCDGICNSLDMYDSLLYRCSHKYINIIIYSYSIFVKFHFLLRAVLSKRSQSQIGLFVVKH